MFEDCKSVSLLYNLIIHIVTLLIIYCLVAVRLVYCTVAIAACVCVWCDWQLLPSKRLRAKWTPSTKSWNRPERYPLLGPSACELAPLSSLQPAASSSLPSLSGGPPPSPWDPPPTHPAQVWPYLHYSFSSSLISTAHF